MKTTEEGLARSVRIGISSCLLGAQVRFDGGHKRDPYLTDVLGKAVTWVPMCPEIEMGLGAPRERMRLVARDDEVRLVALPSGDDLTARARTAAELLLRQARDADLDGFILKSDSPSCGTQRVRLYGPSGQATRSGVGVWAAALLDAMPSLPVEEEGRLRDPAIRATFIDRVFTAARWRRSVGDRPTAATLIRFHAAHKMLVLAHDQAAYRSLGRIVANAGAGDLEVIMERYARDLMTALAKNATRGRHANVLSHLQGFLSEHLDADDRAELTETIERYRRGLVPLIVPITLLRHHLRRHPVAWATDQVYLEPSPAELMLRNHV